MRVWSRIALSFSAVVLLSVTTVFGQFQASCPLTLVSTNPPASPFYESPHGVFRSGSQVFALRGQTLTTYSVTDLGDMKVEREDLIGSLAGRDVSGGVAFSNGFLYVSSEAGLEVYDLRGVRAGGTAPVFVSRTPSLRYRRLAVNGNTLAGLYPATDLPCFANSGNNCYNTIDLYDISNRVSPARVGGITTLITPYGGFNDIAFNYGYLFATSLTGTWAFDVTNRAASQVFSSVTTPGTFLVSNGSNFLAVGTPNAILTYGINPPVSGAPSTALFFNPLTYHTTAAIGIDRSNPIVFHPQATIDDQTNRLITLIDELDPQTLQPARTIAFDVFDYTVPIYQGSFNRIYEQVSYTQGDEVKSNPVVVGPYVYVVGDQTGLQTYGACGQITGRIEFDGINGLTCAGAEIHGWVTGAARINNVEVFLDGGSLGSASLTGPARIDIPSSTPVSPFRIGVNLDATAKGEHLLRAVGTDANGNRRQFASQKVFFNGPGSNCVVRRRSSGSR